MREFSEREYIELAILLGMRCIVFHSFDHSSRHRVLDGYLQCVLPVPYIYYHASIVAGLKAR